MPIKNRHGIRQASANEAISMEEFTAIIVYHTGNGDLEGSPDGGTTWFSFGSYTGNGATPFPYSPGLARATANVTALEGLRGID